jgi:hypothetical protein
VKKYCLIFSLFVAIVTYAATLVQTGVANECRGWITLNPTRWTTEIDIVYPETMSNTDYNLVVYSSTLTTFEITYTELTKSVSGATIRSFTDQATPDSHFVQITWEVWVD